MSVETTDRLQMQIEDAPGKTATRGETWDLEIAGEHLCACLTTLQAEAKNSDSRALQMAITKGEEMEMWLRREMEARAML